MTEQTDL